MTKEIAAEFAIRKTLTGVDLFPLPPKSTIRAIEAYARQDGSVVRLFRSIEGDAYYLSWPEVMGDRAAVIMSREDAYRAFSQYAGVRIVMPAREIAHA